MDSKQRSVRQLRNDEVKIGYMTKPERASYLASVRRRRRIKEVVEGAGLALGVGALFVGILVLVPLVVLGAWNLGIVPAVDASGGVVEKINFLTAFGLSLALSIIKGVLRAIQGKPAIELKGANKA